MTTKSREAEREALREAFEKWLQPDEEARAAFFVRHPSGRYRVQDASWLWEAVKWSRSQALEEAAQACKKIANANWGEMKGAGALECHDAISAMKDQK